MAHSYRILQHWNQWITQHFLGCSLVSAEKQLLKRVLNNHFGKHAVLLGVPHQYELLNSSALPCHTLITPLAHKNKKIITIENDLHELPILTGGVDLVMLPHTLELVDNPRQLLTEACRIIKPEGLIVICGFNPLSSWGAKKMLASQTKQPWERNFIPASKIKAWLHLADFALEQQVKTLFRPPITHRGLYEKLAFLEPIGAKFLPFLGGVYVLLARAKVIPLTPIKMQWKQQLSGMPIPTGMPGQIRVLSK